ncbi:hypothetical protein WR25_02073 [Diploscapter pachys]|uniref:G-patch domain-containing protein n=1 Tax=Diploscapter pachys TaxID=2018661 RepID=A0A2A2K6K9_9BILA|nr:hypothetical protein WR25_02073 [Diploscapter pachys]
MDSQPTASASSESKLATAPIKIAFEIKQKHDVKITIAPVLHKQITAAHDGSDEERETEELLEEEKRAKKRRLTHFEGGQAIGDAEAKKGPAMIPMVVEKDWRIVRLLEMEKEGKLTDEDRAKLALLTEAQPFQPDENQDGSSIKIDETKEDKDTADADYSEMPVENFGLAILRGCGWKDGEGIGKNPKVVPLRILDRRPKGLGLGAKVPSEAEQNGKSANGKEASEDDKQLKPGACVKVIQHRKYTGMYGKIESLDEDNNSAFVRLELDKKNIVTISAYCLQRVSTKEYEKNAKVINIDSYEREKDAIEKRNNEITEREQKKDRKDEKSSSYKREGEYYRSEPTELWARADLLVRFVDEKYKGGRYYEKKLRVVDVASRKNITLEDDQGRSLYEIPQSWIETVIPKSEGEMVMIVGGRHKGQAGEMIAKDKAKSRLSVKLQRNHEIVKVDFDDVCQLVPKHEEDYD